MSKSLFEEAIADAKQLRAVAEQNAKNAIIEAVTPKLKQFIEQQLTGNLTESSSGDFLMSSLSEVDDIEENDSMKEKEVVDEEVELSESALSALMELMNKEKVDEEKSATKSAFDSLSEAEQSAIMDIVKNKNKQEVLEIDLNKKETMPSKTSGDKKMSVKKNDLYELDLDELNEDKITIDFGKDVTFDRENPYSVLVSDSDEEDEDVALSGDMPAEEPADDAGDFEGMDFDAEDTESGESDSDGETPLPDEEEEEEEEESAEPADENTMFEIDESMLRKTLTALREGKSSKETGKTSSHAKAAAKAFGGGDLKDMDEVVMNKFAKLKESFNDEVRKNRGLAQQLNEYRSAVETLREQLSELNLFNAKLLYVNKLTQNKDLSSSQRRSIMEALDGAKTIREAKLLYRSLSESLNKSNPASLSESRKLTPGGSSRATTSGASSRIDESATILSRWSTLAGINK